MKKAKVLIINDAIIFPNMEYRGESIDYKEQDLINTVEKEEKRELIDIIKKN